MKFTLKLTPIGVTIFTALVITQLVFAILAITKAITWKLIFVLLPTIIIVLWGICLLVCFTFMYLKLTREQRAFNRLMRECDKHTSRNYGPRIIPEILAYQASQITNEEEDIFNEHQ